MNWLKHTLWYKDGNRLEYKPVNMKPLTVELPAQGAHLLKCDCNRRADHLRETLTMKFRIYRYDPDKDAKPYMQDYDVALEPHRPDAARRADAHQGSRTTRCRSAAPAAKACAGPTR